MQVVEIRLKDKRVYRVNISDKQDISKLLDGLEVESWNIIQNGIHSLADFNRLKKYI